MESRFSKGLLIFLAVYIGLCLLLFWIVKDDWRQTVVSSDNVNRTATTQEIGEGMELRQEFRAEMDQLNLLTIFANVLPNANTSHVYQIEIVDRQGKKLYTNEGAVKDIPEDGQISLHLSDVHEIVKNEPVTLIIRGNGGMSLWYGNTKDAGKIAVNVETEKLTVNNIQLDGEIVMHKSGINRMKYMDYYWQAVSAIGLLLSGLLFIAHRKRIKGRPFFLNYAADVIKQYSYLLKTLVIRDFKVKYQASVLGVLWSFLNPLLMTFVYMIVFSTLFRSSIEHFPIYLMSGIVIFNYISEATNLGMQSIVGNAGLITKVYIPKYIFPVSKALSSGINLMISLIPLLIMMAVTGVAFHKSLLLLPLLLIFVIVFCIGIGLILAAAMVFFRDIQFLWGIMLTIWNFLSPIFYPESIIPARLLWLYHLNPLYQYLYFARTIILGGISPTPVTYLYCFLASAFFLLAGVFLFKRTQDKFVLHL